MHPLDVDLENWDPWTPSQVAERLRGVDAPWYVLAGWALDLFIGHPSRAHDDIEIGVPADRFPEIREALGDLELVVVGDGRAWPLTESSLTAHRQTWAREQHGPWRLDVMREHWDGQTWICQRDPRIRVPGSELVAFSDEGIPYEQPEIALLFKAKSSRPKDERDFHHVLPALDCTRREWLRWALNLVHPGHRWLEALAA